MNESAPPSTPGDDPRIELMSKVAKLESRYVDQVDETEATWMRVVHAALERWRTSWQEQTSTPTLNPELSRKFRVSFPLAAHALNHVQAAVALQSSSPWVAMSSVRIAFEHALTAQWVLWTKDGEDLLAKQMALQDHRRSSEFVDAVVGAAADTPDLAESAALAKEFGEFLGEKPVSDWSVFNLCERFSSTRLLYGIYRDLTQAVHPSYGLVRAHFDITPPPKVVVGPISPFGTELDSPELIRGMAVSSLWALYVLEVSKAGHPDAADVLRLGEENQLPVDLRASDLQPHLQPDYEAVFTSTYRRHQPTQD
ncbi:DUF5677 domain-containing protein [Mycolicibacterium komossense]|uniref:Uncharacterized protein n=1 Tax=Mycolicibacterium komossense TaxID=1779 RepID=A0ABT3C5B5_9MYCO|nr:DUF5677 domain-containing protein [Mycolicibacterium komossense]MCV7224669.1 hypothetical protein [Mycolicibacterium komossense]